MTDNLKLIRIGLGHLTPMREYLAELLLNKGYQAHGIKRRASLSNTDRIDHRHPGPHADHRGHTLH